MPHAWTDKDLDGAIDEAVAAERERCAKIAAMSGGRRRGEEDQNSFFRKGVVGDWRNYMDDRLARDFCEQVAGPLADFGYTR